MVSAGREHDTHDDYTGAAARLLTLGEKPCHDPGPWADYVTLHGLTRADVPQLIRMARDPALNEGPSSREATWAPVHAWRALGQLRAVEASAALLEHLRDSEFDEFVASDFPEVLEGFGHEAIPAITAFLASEPLRPPAGAAAMNALRRIAQRHPAHRSACVAALTGLLAGADRDGRDLLEAYAIVELVDLAAVESIEAIRAAFARGTVDLSIQGDIEDVEIQLGLRRTRDTPKPRFSRFDPAGWPVSGRAGHVRPPAASPKSGRNDPCPCGSGKKFKKCCLNLEFS